jgi:hypothetical protein
LLLLSGLGVLISTILLSTVVVVFAELIGVVQIMISAKIDEESVDASESPLAQ